MRTTLLLLALLIAAACAEQPSAPVAPGPSPSSLRLPAPSPAPSDGVAVTLTGVPVPTGDGGVEWCAGDLPHEDCAGIPVYELPTDVLADLDHGRPWQVDGVFDGTALWATGAPVPYEAFPGDHDFTTPCEELRGQSSALGQMDLAAREAVEGYLVTIPERRAGTWWDDRNGVLTVLLTGDDVAEQRAALEDAVGDRGAICVVGGARWSEAELEQMQQRAVEVAQVEGMGLWSAAVDAVANRSDLHVERSDEAAEARIREEAGEAVRVHAFITVREARIADLPAAPAHGDVELETAETRDGAGMDALGEFTLRYDPDGNCVYVDAGEQRMGLVWPFGYWAESDPLRVHDADGRIVAREGDVLRAGGGQVPRAGDDACGAGNVWVMNGAPEVVGPSER